MAKEVGKGVIYVDIPSDIDEFGKSFGKAINLIFDEDAMLTLRLKRKFFGDTKSEFVIIAKFIITLLIDCLSRWFGPKVEESFECFQVCLKSIQSEVQ